MIISVIHSILLSSLLLLSLGRGCYDSDDGSIVDSRAEIGEIAMADSLLQIFREITASVNEQRFQDFMLLVDPDERQELDDLVKNHGYSSIKAYLQRQMYGWPNQDTLKLSELISDETYARMTFTGRGERLGGREGFVRYTFVMLKRSDLGWRLSGMSTLEQEVVDLYGNPMAYHETDLPARLRFPRPIMN